MTGTRLMPDRTGRPRTEPPGTGPRTGPPHRTAARDSPARYQRPRCSGTSSNSGSTAIMISAKITKMCAWATLG